MSTVSRFRQGSNNGSLIDYVQQRVQQIRSEDGLSVRVDYCTRFFIFSVQTSNLSDTLNAFVLASAKRKQLPLCDQQYDAVRRND